MIGADPLFLAVAVGVFAAVATLTALRPGVAVAAASGLLPLHLLAVAILDHTILALPAHSVPDVIQVLNRQYALDAAVVGGLVAGALARLLRSRRLPGRPPLLVGFAVVYIVVVGIEALTSSPARPALYSYLVTVAGPAALLVVWGLGMWRSARVVVAAALAAAVGVAVAAIVEQHFGTGVPVWLRGGPPPPPASSYFTNGDTGYRSGSVLGSTLELGFYLSAALPAAIAVAIAGRRTVRAAALIAAAVIAVGLGLSFTRSGWIGAAVGLVVVAVLLPRRRAVRLGVIAGVVVAAGVIGVSALDHGLGDRVFRAGSNQGHADHVRQDLRLLADRPFGHGLGVIDAIGQNFDRGAMADQASEDEYLAKAVEGGIPELLLYGAGTLLLLGSLAAAWRRSAGDAGGAALAAGTLGSAAAVAVASLFLGIESPTFCVPVWAAAGLVIGRPARRPAAPAPPAPETRIEVGRVVDDLERAPAAGSRPHPEPERHPATSCRHLQLDLPLTQ